jgi:hypothetical protein
MLCFQPSLYIGRLYTSFQFILGIQSISLDKDSYGTKVMLLRKKILFGCWKIDYKSKQQGELGLIDLELVSTFHLAKCFVQMLLLLVNGRILLRLNIKPILSQSKRPSFEKQSYMIKTL